MTKVLLALAAALCPSLAGAQLRVSPWFSDGMVLQRDQPNRIFGTAAPDEDVVVRYRNQEARARSGADGRWLAHLPPLGLGEPSDLTIRSRAERITVRGVLMGDVWIGGGQSNMHMTVAEAEGARDALRDAAACPAHIRLLVVPPGTAHSPQRAINATWQACTAANVGAFSAVLYYFGRQLHSDTQVPLGLVHAAWGGTPIATWMPPDVLGTPAFGPYTRVWADQLGVGNADKLQPAGAFHAMIAPLFAHSVAGVLWYQGETDAQLAFGHLYAQALTTLIRGWRAGFGRPDLPFYLVQLPPFGKATYPEHWRRVQDAQASVAQALPRSGYVEILDLGSRSDIHPPNKREVGRRLASLVRAREYLVR